MFFALSFGIPALPTFLNSASGMSFGASSGLAELPKLLPPSVAKPTKPAVERDVASTTEASSRRDRRIQEETLQRHVELIDYANARLQHFRYDQRDCRECFAPTAGHMNSTLSKPSAEQQCRSSWNDFFSKETVDLRFVFGYLDSETFRFSTDGFARQSVIDQVTAPCEDNLLVRVCGFRRSSDDADVFLKEMRGPSGKNHTIRLTLTSSSCSQSQAVRSSGAASCDQVAQTERTEKAFAEGFREADMLIYIGHARDGGGPDFGPARRRKNGSIDYDFYRKEQPGLKKMTEALERGEGKTPKILGFLACDSERWKPRLLLSAPRSGLLLSSTDLIPLEAAAVQAYLALDSVLWQRCENSFNQALEQLDEYNKQQILPPKLVHFFDR